MPGVPSRIVVIGAAETDRLGKITDVSPVALHAQAVRNAIVDAGITRDDIDGVASVGEGPAGLANYLGLVPTWLDGTYVGGCSFLLHLHHAAAAIETGMAKVVVISHAVSRGGRTAAPEGWTSPTSSSSSSRSTVSVLRLPNSPWGCSGT